MKNSKNNMQKQDQFIFDLQQLYNQYGYNQYKMSKFEEYDLYSKNKEFLISDNIITFTDTSGKLLALKPDVTLSIVKNSNPKNGLQKVFYNENVYRISKFSKMFKEIRQVGVEALGDIDDYTISEMIILALKSLAMVSNQYQLAISHLGILKQVIDCITDDKYKQQQILKCIDDKNTFDLKKIVEDENQLNLLEQLLNPSNDIDEIISLIKEMNVDNKDITQLKKIINIVEALGYKDKMVIDFSIVSDLKYYNGIAFKGFIAGLPTRVLAGGQYDNLMKRMKKSSKAIGFAIYMDMLERLDQNVVEQPDVFVLYNEKTDELHITKAIQQLIAEGKKVIATKNEAICSNDAQVIDLREE